MILYYWPSSPHCCMILSVASFLKMQKEMTLISCHPWAQKTPLDALNPLGRVPVLSLSKGGTYLESGTICEKLMQSKKDPHDFMLWPKKEAPDFYRAKKWYDVGLGLMDITSTRILETHLRPQALRSYDLQKRYERITHRVLAWFDKDLNDAGEPVLSLGIIATIIALAHVGLRYPSDGWPLSHPKLHFFYEKMLEIPAFAMNLPKDDHPLPKNIDKIIS